MRLVLTLLALGVAQAQAPDLRPPSDVDLGPATAAIGDWEMLGLNVEGVPWSARGNTERAP